MQFKSIEITGFKSFADKTVVKFDNGITGVVGPNGSGKSNIVEAIKWVLGEQSVKSLRGSKMSDVIFTGSNGRRAVGLAKVVISLDNTDRFLNFDSDEIVITRKLFRNGDSHYYLNNQDCRLKDITALFMDTGLNNTSLAFISQGNVEQIINAKPLERRSIIENLAGIYRYKQQKQVALKKMAATNDNLLRVTDIIQEVESRLPDLSQQSSLATDYLQHQKQLKKLQQQQLIIESQQLLANKATLTVTDQELTTKIASLTAMVADTKQQIAANNQLLKQSQAALAELDDQIDAYSHDLNQQDKQQQLTLQETTFKQSELARLTKQVAEITTTLQQAEQDQQQLLAERKLVQQQLAEVEEQLQTNQRQLQSNDVEKLEHQIEKLRIQLVDKLQQQTQAKNQQQLQQLTNKQATLSIESQTNLIANTQAKLAELTDQNQQLTTQYTELQTQLTDQKQSLTKLTEIKEQKQQSYQKSQDQWLKAVKVAQEAKVRLDSLTALKDSYDDYNFGVKNVLANRDQFKGVLGTVISFAEVEDDYALAIQTALGNTAQHIIIQSSQQASAIINFLTKKQLGKVTLLPLDLIAKPKANQNHHDFYQYDGFVAMATDLVTMPAKVAVVNEFLLGKTVVVDTLDHGIAISKHHHDGYRIVTLAGQFIGSRGTITGGAFKKQTSGLLLVKAELNQLTTVNETMTEKLAQQQAKLTKVQAELAAIDNQTAALTTDVESNDRKLFQLKQQLTANNDESVTVKRDVQAHQLKLNQLMSETDEAINRGLLPADYQEEIDSINAEIDKLHNQISQGKHANQQLTELDRDLAGKQGSLQSKLEQLTERKSRLAAEITTKNHQLQTAVTQQTELKRWLESVNSQVTEVDLAKLKHQLAAAKQKKEQLSAQISDYQATKEQFQQQSQLVTGELKDVNYQQQITQTKLAQITNELTEKERLLKDQYQITDVAAVTLEGMQVAKIKQQIKLINKGLQEIGPVNVNSIQEYQTVKERFEFLNTQKADLLTSQSELTNTMNKMNRTIVTRFKKTYDQLNKAFQVTFKEMFGGGKAEIKLTDEHNLIETGIEIIVSPPGKKTHQLSLLSGGEKTLTAISLLFSMLKVQPVPFCILDEAEAALDPYNADRFANYLNEYTEQTQFIVITHRKETMAHADRLYGVTMQESGVSKMVTVSLK